MNGSVSPVSGMSVDTPPTTTNTWMSRVNARPTATSLPKLSRMVRPTRIPRSTMMRYTISTAARPIRPSSSPMVEVMKSVFANGTWSGRPLPSPVPPMPPEASPNRACEL